MEEAVGNANVHQELTVFAWNYWKYLNRLIYFSFFTTAEKKDTILRQVRLDPCDLQPIFDDTLHILNQEELGLIEEIPHAEDKLDKLFEIAGGKSQDASQKLLDSIYSHLPDLL